MSLFKKLIDKTVKVVDESIDSYIDKRIQNNIKSPHSSIFNLAKFRPDTSAPSGYMQVPTVPLNNFSAPTGNTVSVMYGYVPINLNTIITDSSQYVDITRLNYNNAGDYCNIINGNSVFNKNNGISVQFIKQISIYGSNTDYPYLMRYYEYTLCMDTDRLKVLFALKAVYLNITSNTAGGLTFNYNSTTSDTPNSMFNVDNLSSIYQTVLWQSNDAILNNDSDKPIKYLFGNTGGIIGINNNNQNAWGSNTGYKPTCNWRFCPMSLASINATNNNFLAVVLLSNTNPVRTNPNYLEWSIRKQW